MSRVTTISSVMLEAEQYLGEDTNWDSLCAIVGSDNIEVPDFDPNGPILVTYLKNDFEMKWSDWVVKYPDGTLHFFTKDTFDSLYQNIMGEPLTQAELDDLLKEKMS